MNNNIKTLILKQFVQENQQESAIKQPINISISEANATTMTTRNTLVTNDNNYFIRYGGVPNSGSYNAIEVYSVNSIENNQAIHIFTNIKVGSNSIYLIDLHQDEDGRFYGIGYYNNGSSNTFYLLIFNNFIQDGYLQINKSYSGTQIGFTTSGEYWNKVTKRDGIYFIFTSSKIVRFEINILEGNETKVANVINGGTITSGAYYPQINILKNQLIITKLWEDTSTYGAERYEYTKAVINIDEDFPENITLSQVYYKVLGAGEYIQGAYNDNFEAVIPYMYGAVDMAFIKVRLDGTVITKICNTDEPLDHTNFRAFLKNNYGCAVNGTKIFLYYFDNTVNDSKLTLFYEDDYSTIISGFEILENFNIKSIIGINGGSAQKIILIKNIYSYDVTSEPYYNNEFLIPYYMNLYSKTNDDTSLMFSRNATIRFMSGNQITANFTIPHYLLNNVDIKKTNIYGKSNQLMNEQIEDLDKNKFENLNISFMYNMNVIDNTSNLNRLNQEGSNRAAKIFWGNFDNSKSRLSKVRLTYDDLTTEIKRLNFPSGPALTNPVYVSYSVNGHVIKIEYISEDEKTIYATYNTNITGSHSVMQTISVL